MVKLQSPLPNSICFRMLLQRALPAGFIAPCLPTKTDKLPSGSQWLHEIKHDGFRLIAGKDGERVRLYSRPGNDFTRRFPLIVEALIRLRSRSCIIDGEAVVCDDNGVASFDRIRHQRHDGDARAGARNSWHFASAPSRSGSSPGSKLGDRTRLVHGQCSVRETSSIIRR